MTKNIAPDEVTQSDILKKIQAGIEQVTDNGGSFDIEMSEAEYESYKKSLLPKEALVGQIAKDTIIQTPEKEVPTTAVTAERSVLESITVKSGESMYLILMREFKLGSKITRLGARYNALENILEKIRLSPNSFGITSGDAAKPNLGDVLSLEKIQTLLDETLIAEKSIVDHANSLPDVVVQGIEEYMPNDAKKTLLEISDVKIEEVGASPDIIIPILNDPKGGHTLETGHDELLIADHQTKSNTETVTAISPMTENESTQVTKRLQEELKLHIIPWRELMVHGAEKVSSFAEMVSNNPETQKLINIIKIHHAKTDIPMEDSQTVLEYLQLTTLHMVREGNN